MRKLLALLVLIVLLPVHAGAQSDIFGRYTGTFLLYDESQDLLTVYNPDRAEQRFAPYSTFKLINASIGLETGAIPNEDFVIAYEADKYPIDDGGFFPADVWARDHDLRSALSQSVVWYFVELAGLIGQERMAEYVDRAEYGNMDISAWIDDVPFWLGSTLEISAYEQLDFLRRWHHGEIFSAETVATVSDILTLEQTDTYRLVGKTGTRGSTLQFGWLVGFVERGEDVYFYVMNIDADPAVRTETAFELLRRYHLIDS